jgi:hypothetical protein
MIFCAAMLSGCGGGSGGTPSTPTPTPTVTYALSVAVTGSGSVTSSPTGIDCGNTCSASYASGTQVTLTATPASGATFSTWGGACSGQRNWGQVYIRSTPAHSLQIVYPRPIHHPRHI